MQNIVNEGKSPISRFKIRRDAINFLGFNTCLEQTRCWVATVRWYVVLIGKANVVASAASVSPSILGSGHMTDVKTIKWVSHFDDCMIIRYQISVTDLIFSFNLINNQFWITISFKVVYPYFMGELKANSRALYSATLLEHGSVNENTLGRTWFGGEINTTPTPAMILSLGPILDAPSKNICHTSSSKVILDSKTSSGMSS